MAYYIKNKKPVILETYSYTEDDFVLNGYEHIYYSDVYTCMYCEEVKNITMILTDCTKITFLFDSKNEFMNMIQLLQRQDKFSIVSQNKKINSYATAIIEKKKEGIDMEIISQTEKKNVKYCPVCGMECDPNIPYCMECGAEV